MRAAIVGGTGTLGRLVTEELRGRGHEVRALSRSAPQFRVDLRTGDGLTEALDGCEVVVDASNNASPRRAAATLVEGSRRLLDAELAAGVRHHVGISIVGCERVPLAYYRVKSRQEAVVEQDLVPWSLVRSTQFHELIASTFARVARWGALPVLSARLQTAACAEVAVAVADVALGAPLRARQEVAGPELADTRALARAWRKRTGSRAVLIPLPLPGELGRALRAGGLTTEHPDIRTRISFTAWLAAQNG